MEESGPSQSGPLASPLTIINSSDADKLSREGARGKSQYLKRSPSSLQNKQSQRNGGAGRIERPPKKRLKGRKPKIPNEGSAEEVLMADIRSLVASLRLSEIDSNLATEKVADAKAKGGDATETATSPKTGIAHALENSLPLPGMEILLRVVSLSSTGDGLAVQVWEGDGAKDEHLTGRERIYVVSFAVPGDLVRARVYRHFGRGGVHSNGNADYDDHATGDDDCSPAHSVADLISVVRPSHELRDDSRVRCRYFGRCSGCQYQMLDYAEQLRIKRRVVERAYEHFSQLPPEMIPPVLETVASPLQFGYRTKLTPHFDGPPGFRRKNKSGQTLQSVPAIGFMTKGGGPRTTLDIEQCPIGTPAVSSGMTRERARVAREYGSYQRGATILLRESTNRIYKDGDKGGEEMDAERKDVEGEDGDGLTHRVEADSYVELKTCITNSNATSREYIDDYVFTNPAGSFFQNNNSILPALTAYVRENVRPKDGSARPFRYLIDAYSGSGLFTITLAATLPGGSIGIDISDQSIAYARTNATLNNLAPDRCRFIAADAAQLFAGVVEYDPNETVVVLDPPRKGCDAVFLRQLLAFAPARIVYVSCNVHTQARDVGMLVSGEVGGDRGKEKDVFTSSSSSARYEIESLRGFDFFPQTAHVEGVAVLNRVDQGEQAESKYKQ